ncbi:hypothetical protein HPB50_002768 [Hyalomma asiaticum]|uniref:Uncharacterized protein n=1 Tax=Hyalomma asiaticum TaxID=266040 RepID=A0ACB7S4B4_HYAAI|nr:hypothetical protein HPB50_002768 [Hyalomma asiaticum]
MLQTQLGSRSFSPDLSSPTTTPAHRFNRRLLGLAPEIASLQNPLTDIAHLCKWPMPARHRLLRSTLLCFLHRRFINHFCPTESTNSYAVLPATDGVSAATAYRHSEMSPHHAYVAIPTTVIC